MNFSLTWSSSIAFFILFVLKAAGIELAEESVTNFVYVGAQIITAIGIFWGRYRQGDINLFGKKA